jgi:hypothetical protein
MKALRIVSLVVLAGGTTVGLTGCGAYTTKSQYRPGIKTVAVPIWTRGKDVYRRDLEIDLTEALVKRIEQDTPYKVTSEARADTKLTGRIVRIQQRVLSKSRETGRAIEVEATFVIAFTWTDLRTGKELEKRTNVRVAGTYLPTPPFREEFFQGSQAIINKAARRVVEAMEAPW